MAVPKVRVRRSVARRWAPIVGVAAMVGGGLMAPVAAHATAPSADMSVSITHSPGSGLSGADLTFSLTARNDGPDTAQAVLVAMSFDYPFEFESASDGCELAGNQLSVICTAGDLVSGASITETVTVKSHASGLFIVPAAVSSDTADPDTADRSASDSVIVQPGPSQGVRYVTGVFPLVLQRPVDSASLTYWSGRFNQLQRTRQPLDAVPLGWMNSNEYRRIRVREAYQRILQRPPSTDDLTYWTAKLAGGLTYLRFDQTLIGSHEFTRVWPGGAADQIEGAYKAVLGRTCTRAELDAVHDAVESGHKTLASLASDLQRSAEGLGRVVAANFQLAVGHAPSKAARYYAVLDLVRGLSAERQLAHLLVSNEVLAKYPPTDDDYVFYDTGSYPALHLVDFRHR